jgi:NADPH:quinone reductase-like Zn-dependent oxidoreductase
MKAIILTEYGLPEVLELKEVEKPIPKDNEVMIQVCASSVTTHNLFLISGKPFVIRLMNGGLHKPKIATPGSDMAGRVAAVGKDVQRFRPSDEVFGDLTPCGFGAFAEYVCVPETVLTSKPSNVTFEEAAAVPQAALVALQGLRDKGHIQKGQKVLIYGASGGIGTFAVQIAKYFGAEVTGVCSTRSLDMVRSIGADKVIDYTTEDFLNRGQLYDLIFAIAYRSIFDFRRALHPQGIYVSTGGPSMKRIFQDMVVGPMISRTKGKRLVGGWALIPNKGLAFIKELIEAGKIKPIIDRRYTFGEVAKAFRYYAEGHSKGKVVVAVEDISEGGER